MVSRLIGIRQLALVLLIAVVLPPFLVRSSAHAARIDPNVYEALTAAPDGQAKFIVLFAERADLSGAERLDWDARGQFVMERLRSVAERSQAHMLARMAARTVSGRVTKYQPFWIANAIAVTGDRAAVETLAQMPGVSEILPEMKLDAPESPEPVTTTDVDLTWGIERIGADQVWSAYGKTGQGTVIGLVDTGVQWDHTSLKEQYRGWNGTRANHNYSWWDPARLCSPTGRTPCDSNGHGTHTTGTAAGGNSVEQGPIGVAPGAKWIHALGCCPDNAALLSALQWMIAPTDLNGAYADPRRRPNVVNNSWGGPGGSKIFDDVIGNLRAAGIVPVFSAGNSGSACGTLGSPGDNLPSFNVGNTTFTDTIANSSSRGSNPFTGATGPHVSAPGTGIYSSIPGNHYTTYTGTSMAAPHVAGAVALLMSVEPDLVGKVDQVEEILRKTAVDITTTQTCGGVVGWQIPNNAYGWGRIDVKAAADLAANAGTLSGTITDAGTGAPIAAASVSITRNTYTLTQQTAADGTYSFTTGAGSYDLSVDAFGYQAATATGVGVNQDGTTDGDFSLTDLSNGTISGRVLEDSDPARPVVGATASVLQGGAGLTTLTAGDGSYTLSNVPFGSQDVQLRSPGYQALMSSVVVDGAETLDFAPAAVPDYLAAGSGEACAAEYAWIDATTGTAYNLGDDSSVSVALPWSFTFYGASYTTIYIGSNGFVSFGSGYSKWHGIIPFEGAPNNQIIGLGEDLNPANGAQGTVYTQDMGDGRFVIQYDQVQHWASGNPETFEIILHRDDGSIVVQYEMVSWPEFANAGIENADGSRGIQYSYANDRPLVSGLAVKYTPFTGQPPACAAPAAPALAITCDGGGALLRWQHNEPNTSYEVWRGTTPFFDPVELFGAPEATAGAMFYPGGASCGDPANNSFWLVKGVRASEASGPSNRVGGFAFALTHVN